VQSARASGNASTGTGKDYTVRVRGPKQRHNQWKQWALQAHREAHGCFIHATIIHIAEKWHVSIETEETRHTSYIDEQTEKLDGFNSLFDALEYANKRIEELVNKE
jgi:hypothetical protein